MTRKTDELSEFDLRQLILFEEGSRRHKKTHGAKEARRLAVDGMPLVFDSAPLETGAVAGDSLLPSYLAQILSWVSRRSDWDSRYQRLAGELREAHLVEAKRRLPVR